MPSFDDFGSNHPIDLAIDRMLDDLEDPRDRRATNFILFGTLAIGVIATLAAYLVR